MFLPGLIKTHDPPRVVVTHCACMFPYNKSRWSCVAPVRGTLAANVRFGGTG